MNKNYGIYTHYYYAVKLPLEILADSSNSLYYIGTFDRRTNRKIRESVLTYNTYKEAERIFKSGSWVVRNRLTFSNNEEDTWPGMPGPGYII